MNTARELFDTLGNLLIASPELNDLPLSACGVPGSLICWRDKPDGPIIALSYEDDSYISEYENNAREWIKDINAGTLSKKHLEYLTQMCLRGEAHEDIIAFIRKNAYALYEQNAELPSPLPAPSNTLTYSINTNKKIRVTKTDIADIVNTALDGGVTAQWVIDMQVKDKMLGEFGGEHIAAGGTLHFLPSGEKEYKELTLLTFLSGIKNWYENNGDIYHAVQKDGSLDLCNIDAATADAILQFALFQEMVFE